VVLRVANGAMGPAALCEFLWSKNELDMVGEAEVFCAKLQHWRSVQLGAPKVNIKNEVCFVLT
jgi:hypothetical protein